MSFFGGESIPKSMEVPFHSVTLWLPSPFVSIFDTPSQLKSSNYSSLPQTESGENIVQQFIRSDQTYNALQTEDRMAKGFGDHLRR